MTPENLKSHLGEKFDKNALEKIESAIHLMEREKENKTTINDITDIIRYLIQDNMLLVYVKDDEYVLVFKGYQAEFEAMTDGSWKKKEF